MYMDDPGPGKPQPQGARSAVPVTEQGRRILETVAQITLHRNDAVELLRRVLKEVPPDTFRARLRADIQALVKDVDDFVAAMPR